MKNFINDLKSKSPVYFSSVEHLREILGQDVVLLGWPIGKKGAPRKWGHLTIADMTQGYIKKLRNLNIGVALGKKSGGLIALDIDDENFLQSFVSANPLFENTLITHGSRGAVFWFRMVGEYPAETKVLKTSDEVKIGEFRSNGGQAIIRGVHPDTGNQYRILNLVKPLTIEFSKIIWPAEIITPPTANRTERRETEVTEESEDTHAVGDCVPSLSLAPFVLPNVGLPVTSDDHTDKIIDYSTLSISEAVGLSMPNKPHQNNDCLFTLARAVLRMESNAGNKKFTPEHLREIFGLWHQSAKPYLRTEQSRDDYLIQFMNAYKSAKFPLGGDGVELAWRNANQNPLPAEALASFEDPDKRMLVSLCRELQVIHGENPFFISCRKVQSLFNLGSPDTGARWLRSLCVMGILEIVEKGTKQLAARYRFKFQPPPIGLG